MGKIESKDIKESPLFRGPRDFWKVPVLLVRAGYVGSINPVRVSK
tara:strand:- start:482 stop:616 length:135 start_codon:yes stop_codon:yes gene_type:complete